MKHYSARAISCSLPIVQSGYLQDCAGHIPDLHFSTSPLLQAWALVPWLVSWTLAVLFASFSFSLRYVLFFLVELRFRFLHLSMHKQPVHPTSMQTRYNLQGGEGARQAAGSSTGVEYLSWWHPSSFVFINAVWSTILHIKRRSVLCHQRTYSNFRY